MGKLKWLFTEGVTDLTSYRLGQVQERERIIKLLWERFDCGDPKCIHDECCFVEEAIALIKGEQK